MRASRSCWRTRSASSVAFEVDDALARLKRLDLLSETGGCFSALPLPEALARLDSDWDQLLQPSAG